jgi:thiol:disulfide interchange protein DsbD
MKKLLFILALFVSLPGFAADPLPAGGQDELLEPDQAFSLSTRVVDAGTLEAKWVIADGYYLYRDKFKFDVIKGDSRLLSPKFPKGKRKTDPLFGEVETYLHSVIVQLPLKRAGATAENLTLRITAQGCNEPVGVCYPPITKEISFALPPMAAAAKPKVDSINALKQLVQPSSDMGPEFLHPDEAFKLGVTAVDKRTLNAHFAIVDGYYLYRDKIRFSLEGAGGSARIGKIELPEGKTKVDPTFGRTVVYTKSFDAKVPVIISSGDSMAAVLNVSYQGCAEKGICYPPVTRKINLALAAGAVGMADTTAATMTTPEEAGTESTISARDYWLAILGAFGVGLILTFTPCVLPMIPILSSIIVGQGGQQITKLRGGFLAMVYVLGTSVTYTLAGILAGATGDQLQAYFQNVWAIGIFSSLLVLLALSMFGFYEIQMPSFIQSRLQTRSQSLKGGSAIGVFVMGLISALIVGACVSPLLMAALGAAIATKDPVLGGLIMFSMSMGMGAILIGLGFGAGFLLPKAGVWMDRVKYFFGVLLLGVAIYLLGLLPQVPVLYLWATLFIVTAIYLGAIEPLPSDTSGWRTLSKGIGMVLLIWGVLALIGAFSGNRDILRPVTISALTVSTPGTATALPGEPDEHVFERVSNLAELDAKLASARAEGKPVILDYFATWCTDCVRMEKTTFVDPQVKQILRDRFIALQVDVTDPNNAATKTIKQRYSVFGPPAMIFIDASGEVRKDLNFYGYKSPKEFIEVLKQV